MTQSWLTYGILYFKTIMSLLNSKFLFPFPFRSRQLPMNLSSRRLLPVLLREILITAGFPSIHFPFSFSYPSYAANLFPLPAFLSFVMLPFPFRSSVKFVSQQAIPSFYFLSSLPFLDPMASSVPSYSPPLFSSSSVPFPRPSTLPRHKHDSCGLF